MIKIIFYIIIIKLINNRNIPLFISFASKCEQKTTLENNIYEIYGIFGGTSCYLINRQAIILLQKMFPLKYQIYFQIGHIIQQYRNSMVNNDIRALLFEDSGIKQSNIYESDVQYYFININ